MTSGESSVRWHPFTRIAFRLTALYFGLYVATTQMLGALLPLPVGRLPDVGSLLDGYVSWVGRTIFGVSAAPVVSGLQKFRHEFEALITRKTVHAVPTIVS